MSDDGTITRLYNNLLHVEEVKNTMRIDKFIEQFGLLFNKSYDRILNSDRIEKLTDEYRGRFNLYRPITLTDINGDVIVTLPPMFKEVQATSNTDVGALLAGFKTDKFPAESAKRVQVFKKVIDVLNPENKTDDRRKFQMLVDKFYETKNNADQIALPMTKKEPPKEKSRFQSNDIDLDQFF